VHGHSYSLSIDDYGTTGFEPPRHQEAKGEKRDTPFFFGFLGILDVSAVQ
jgi:hypothetical protein